MQNPNIDVIKQNGLVLANASALAFGILSEMGDQHISPSVNGESMTRDVIENLVTLKLSTTVQQKA